MEDSNPPVQANESQQNVVTSKPAFSHSLHSQLSCPAPQGPERGGSPCGPSPNGSPLVGRSRKKYSYPAVSSVGGGMGVHGSPHLNLPASPHQYIRHGRQVMVSSHIAMFKGSKQSNVDAQIICCSETSYICNMEIDCSTLKIFHAISGGRQIKCIS